MSTRTRPGGRTRLDPAAVITEALALADQDGLEAVTIRRLAQHLGVTPMALYWHFDDKDALLDAVGDRLWHEAAEQRDQMAVDDPSGDDPWAALRQILEAIVSTLGRHRAVAALAPPRALTNDSGLALTEAALAALSACGYETTEAADMACFLLDNAVMLSNGRPGTGVGTDSEDEEAKLRAKRGMLMALPPGRYPHVTASASALTDCDNRDRYEQQGLAVLVAGLRAMVAAGARPAPAP